MKLGLGKRRTISARDAHTLAGALTIWVWLLLLGAILYATQIRKRS